MIDSSKSPPNYCPPTSVDEVLRRYGSGERFFHQTDLAEGSSFQNATLVGSDFTGSWLSGIDFRGADLREVCFDQSNVKVSDFRNADLTGASFRDSALCGGMFGGGKLENVCVEGATYYGAPVTDIRQLAETESPK